MIIEALTRYGVRIPRAFADKASALAWAEQSAGRYPGCRIIRKTASGAVRTLWRHEPEGLVA